MPSLAEAVQLVEKRAQIIAACQTLLDQEVAKKGGLQGFLVKGAYAILNAVHPKAVTETIDHLLDEFVSALDPSYQAHLGQPSHPSFGARLLSQPRQTAETLLGVTDRRAQRAKHAALKGAYGKLRGSALHHVTEAVPGLSSLLDRFLSA